MALSLSPGSPQIRPLLASLSSPHINPYGKFTLDMNTHLDLDPAGKLRAA
jgi:hypothetical protein